MNYFTKLFIFIFLLTSAMETIAQGTIQEYGKNRVQYDDDFKYWNEYESQNFILYYYGKSKDVVEAALNLAETNSTEIRKILQYRFNEKIEIIVYADIHDFKQSNIGNEEIFKSRPGITKIVGSKMFVYHSGDYRDLNRQIREGITQVYLEQMQVSTSLQEFVQSAVNSDLPPWFTQGIVAYIGGEWNSDIENQLRQIFLAGIYKDFYDLASDEPRLAGHMFWNYVSSQFGQEVISNLLYLNRINRRLENSFIYSLGTPIGELVEKVFGFYQKTYLNESIQWDSLYTKDLIALKNKRNIPYSQLALHPKSNKIAYVTNEIGQYKVFIKEEGKKRKKLLQKGSRNPFQVTDYDNPLIRWNKRGNILGMVHTHREKTYFHWWNFRTGEKDKILLNPRIEKVYSFDFYGNRDIVLAASERGQLDVYLFDLRRRNLEQLTEDYFDDRYVSTARIGGKNGILFSSNRTNDLLIPQEKLQAVPLNNFDLFFLELTEDANRIHRLTLTPKIDEQQPQFNGKAIYYLAELNGMNRAFKGTIFQKVDSVGTKAILNTGRVIKLGKGQRLQRVDPRLVDTIIPWQDTIYTLLSESISNFGSNLEQLSVSKSHLFYTLNDKTKPKLYLSALDSFQEANVSPSIFYSLSKLKRQNLEKKAKEKEKIKVEKPVEKHHSYTFQSPFSDPEDFKANEAKIEAQKVLEDIVSKVEKSVEKRVQKQKHIQFIPSRSIAYRLQFKFENIITNLDNEPLFGGLNTFAGQPQGYNFPPLGLLGKFTVSDLFEDYEITAGVRLPTSFNGSEYFIYFDDRKKRLDKRYALYRRSQSESLTSPLNVLTEQNFINLIGIFELRYPLDIFRSIRMINTLRFDTERILSADQPSLAEGANQEQRIGIRLEYVFDNTYLVQTNMLNGSRYKFWVEGMNRFTVDFDNGEYSISDAFMTLLGLDARHYQRLGKHAILAGRLAGATSFGSEQILYFMGGVENWFFAENSDLISIPPAGNFAYQNLAANMRGFKQNSRNGASYILSNLELRVAPFNYLSSRPLRSKFLRNFQITGFVDVGTAWYGLSPYDDENPLNTIIRDNPNTPVDIEVQYFRDPLILGVGSGIRFNLFGYFLKLDYAWGYDTKVWQDPILYLSMGYDF